MSICLLFSLVFIVSSSTAEVAVSQEPVKELGPEPTKRADLMNQCTQDVSEPIEEEAEEFEELVKESDEVGDSQFSEQPTEESDDKISDSELSKEPTEDFHDNEVLRNQQRSLMTKLMTLNLLRNQPTEDFDDNEAVDWTPAVTSVKVTPFRSTKPMNKFHKNSNTLAHLQTMHQNLMQGVKDQMESGGKVPVSKEVGDALELQFTLLENGLTTEVASQQIRANALNNPIEACGAAKNTAFTRSDGVNFLATTVSTARDTHRTCREDELTQCSSYMQEATTLWSSAPTCSSHWGTTGPQITTIAAADAVLDCMAEHVTWMTNYESLVNKNISCSTSMSTCNTNQGTFELDFCQYREGLVAACDGLANCLEPAGQATLVAQRATEQADLQMLEATQKQSYIVVQKCKCWINLLRVDAAPTQAQFDNCTDLDPSTSDLNITYPTFLAVETCDTTPVTNFPGDGTWHVSEYDNQAWTHLLQPVTPCATAPSLLTPDAGTYHGLTGFIAFNWANDGATFPVGEDPLGEAAGTGGCASLDSPICRGRIPTGVQPTHLLVKKGSSTWALWSFDGSLKANAFLQMAQSHQPVCSSIDEGAWTPVASSGGGWGCGSSCNVLGYTDGTAANQCGPHTGYASNGWNYILDDDGHWCNAAFKMGATFNSGIPDDYGFLNEGCGTKVGGSMLYLA